MAFWSLSTNCRRPLASTHTPTCMCMEGNKQVIYYVYSLKYVSVLVYARLLTQSHTFNSAFNSPLLSLAASGWQVKCQHISQPLWLLATNNMAASAHTYKYQPSPPVSNFHMPRTKWSIKNGVGWLVYVGFWPKAFLALFAAYIHTRFNVNMYIHVYVYVYVYVCTRACRHVGAWVGCWVHGGPVGRFDLFDHFNVNWFGAQICGVVH